MKKIVLPFFSYLLALTLLFGSFGNAKAAVGDDPVVTPVSGDMEFTTEVVPIASMPGTIELASLMLAPAGFPEGEAQFEGAGVLVTKFDAGKATACFTISGTKWGWGGKVGKWDGAKWVLLPTTIKTTGDDGTATTACATITGSGTYTFIKYVTDPTLLPTKVPCNYGITHGWGTADQAENINGIQYGYINNFEFYSTTDLSGKSVTISLIRSEPVNGYVWFGLAKGVIYSGGGGWYYMHVSPTVYYTWVLAQSNQPFWHLDFGNCYQDVTTDF